jgi:ribonuclease VapC
VIVLDASALLALIKDEAGADVVARAAGAEDATISAVNYAKTLQMAARAGVAIGDVDVAPEALGITVIPFSRLDARLTASFYRHQSQLSHADRVCLALARSLSSVAFTADRAWEGWADELGVVVRVIR